MFGFVGSRRLVTLSPSIYGRFCSTRSLSSFLGTLGSVKDGVVNGATYVKDGVVEGGSLVKDGVIIGATYAKDGVVEGGTTLVHGAQMMTEYSTEKSIDTAVETLKLMQTKLTEADMADAVETKLSMNLGVLQLSFRLLKETSP